MPSRHDYKRALQIFQSRRLHRDHADLEHVPEYRRLSAFVFEDLYGPRDFSARDRQARSIAPLLKLLPGLTVRDVLQVFRLLDFSDHLDDAVVDQLIAMKAPLRFDEATYEQAYRRATPYAPRVRQLDEVHNILLHVHHLAHNPLLGVALDTTPLLARAAGLREIHRFLQHGYHALEPVSNIMPFVETIDSRERQRLDRIYQHC